MECMIAEKDAPLNSETSRYLLRTAIGDGGQWDMMVALVKKARLSWFALYCVLAAVLVFILA